MLTSSASSSPPTMWAPARLASSACRPSAKTKIVSSDWDFASRGQVKRPLGIVTPFGIAVLTTSSKVALGRATSTAYEVRERWTAKGPGVIPHP